MEIFEMCDRHLILLVKVLNGSLTPDTDFCFPPN